MRILFLLPDYPFPPNSGGKSKVYSILKILSTQHQCDLLCFSDSNSKNINDLFICKKNINSLGIFKKNHGFIDILIKLKNILFGIPPSFSTYESNYFVKELKKYLSIYQYDIIHIDIINMAQYRKYIHNIPIIHSPNDATSLIYSRLAMNTTSKVYKLKFTLASFLLRKYEVSNYHKFTKIIVASNTDYKYFINLDNRIKIDTIPIMVEENYFSKSKVNNNNEILNNNLKIVCVGDVSNVGIKEGVLDFINITFPEILKIWPHTQFILLSKNFDEKEIIKLEYRSNITIVKYVDNYIDFIINSNIVLIPDKYGPDGVKTRTLQAMALGMPVIATNTGFADIPIVDGTHGVIYYNQKQCTELLVQLIENKEMRINLGNNANKLILNNFSSKNIAPYYYKLYNEINLTL